MRANGVGGGGEIKAISCITLSPLARLMARRGRNTRRTRRIFTEDKAPPSDSDAAKLLKCIKCVMCPWQCECVCGIHLIPMEKRLDVTTTRSSKLNPSRQKEPLCRITPYTTICPGQLH